MTSAGAEDRRPREEGAAPERRQGLVRPSNGLPEGGGAGSGRRGGVMGQAPLGTQSFVNDLGGGVAKRRDRPDRSAA